MRSPVPHTMAVPPMYASQKQSPAELRENFRQSVHRQWRRIVTCFDSSGALPLTGSLPGFRG